MAQCASVTRGVIRPRIDRFSARLRDCATRGIAPGPPLALGDVLPALRVAFGDTQITVSLHGLAVVLGVGAGALLAVRRAGERAPVLVAVAAVTAASLAGGHALFALLHGGHGALWTGGLASTGGVAAGLATAFVVARATRRPAGELLDVLVPAGLLALAIGRVGCFLAGCCYGRPTAFPWGVVFPALGPPARHPLQLYSAAGDLLLVLLLPRHAPVRGAVARRGCITFGCLRVALETLRDPATTDLVPGGWLTLPQAAALLLALIAASLRPREPSMYASLRRSLAHGR